MPDILTDEQVGLEAAPAGLSDADVGLSPAPAADIKLSRYEQARMRPDYQPMGPFGPTQNPEEALRPFTQIPGDIAHGIGKVIQPLMTAGGDIVRETLREYGISPETIQYPEGAPLPITPTGTPPLSVTAPESFGAGVEQKAGELLHEWTSPEQLSILPFAALKPAQAVFGLQAAAAIPESVQELTQAKTPQEFGSALTGGAANALIAGLMGKHLVGERPYARSIETPAEIHGNVRPQPGQGQWQVPAQEGGPGIQPSPEAVAEAPQVPLTPDKIAEQVGGWKFEGEKEGYKIGEVEVPPSLRFTGTEEGKKTTIHIPADTPPEEIAQRLALKSAEFVTADEVMKRDPAETTHSEIMGMPDEEVLKLADKRDAKGNQVYDFQAQGAAWGAGQSPKLRAEVSKMLKETDAKEKQILDIYKSGKAPTPEQVIENKAAFHRRSWLNGAIEGLKREGVQYDKAKSAGLIKEAETPPPSSQAPPTKTRPGATVSEKTALKPPTPKTFAPDHIDWDNPAAWSPVSASEQSDPLALSKKFGEEGRGREFGRLESETKRLLVMTGKDGKVHVVSTYTPGRTGPRVVDPARAKSAKPNRQLREILKDYTPQYTLFLKEPVKNFHKVYDSMEEFFQDFGNEARQRAAGVAAYPEPPPAAFIKPGMEVGDVEVPAPEPNEPISLTSAEAASLHQHIGQFANPGEAVEAIAQAPNKNQIQSAFRKAIDAILEKEPNLTEEQAAANALKQFYDLHQASPQDPAAFHRQALAALGQGAPEATPAQPPQGAPKAGVQVKGADVPHGTLYASYFAAPAAHPLGPVAPSSVPAAAVFQWFSEAISKVPDHISDWWRGFSMQTLPKITKADRLAGEAGARYSSAGGVARAKGLEFADKVIEDAKEPLFDTKFGTALTEDNLRSIRNDLRSKAVDLKRQSDEAFRQGDPDKGTELFDQATKTAGDAGKVTTLVGAENSPFRDEQAYQRFLAEPETQAAIRRHVQLWDEQKDPIYRKANDLDPDVPLPSRGAQTGARVNLKAVLPEEGTKTTIGPSARPGLIRQSATFLRRDPFARQAKGTGVSYEDSYREIMANGFQREYPVAAQHDFIKALIDSGDAVVSNREFDPDAQIKGESVKGYELKLRPWLKQGRAWLQIRKSLAKEYEDATGLASVYHIPIYTPISQVLTKQSIMGLAEGSTHIANLTTQVLTGLGPTANPMLNALIKSAGRADVLWQLPKVLMKGFTNQKEAILALAEIGAAKDPYRGTIGWLITRIDQGVRLNAAETYKGMAAKGWVPDTETGLREYVNQVGQYNKALQPRFIRMLRETGVQPFATASHTFLVQGLRHLTAAPGAEGTSFAAKLALRADKAAGILGFVALVSAINYLVSKKTTGPPGTPLGSVGWIGDDGKLHTFNAARLAGYERAWRATGVGPYVEARRLGLNPNTALRAGVQGPAGAALQYATGPLNRFAAVAATGQRPGVPMVQEAPVVPPRDDMAPLKSQAAANVLTALQEMNPAVDAIARYKQGKPLQEIAQRQFSRYTPRTGMSQETIAALPKIIKAAQLQAYVDAVAKEARKLPLMDRAQFITDRLAKDQLTGENYQDALKRLRRKGVYRYQ